MGNEVKKCMGVEKLTDNRFLNLYHMTRVPRADSRLITILRRATTRITSR